MKEQIAKYCRELRLGNRMSEEYEKIEAATHEEFLAKLLAIEVGHREVAHTNRFILTTNLEFSKWSTIFYDEKLTAALIDCLVHHSHLITFQGPSYRYQHSSINL